MSATTGLRQAERGGWRHSITSSRAQKQDGGSKYSLFSTFMRFDSMKATLSLCSVYSWRRSSLAASIFRGFLEAWTRRLGLTARLCSATEDVNLRTKWSCGLGLECHLPLVYWGSLTWSMGSTIWFPDFIVNLRTLPLARHSPDMKSQNLGDRRETQGECHGVQESRQSQVGSSSLTLSHPYTHSNSPRCNNTHLYFFCY